MSLEWIILNQFGRRNLPAYERAKLALKLEPIIAAKGKENQKGGQGGVLLPQKSAEAKPVETRQEIAKVANVSHDTIAKVKKIEAKAPLPQSGIQTRKYRAIYQILVERRFHKVGFKPTLQSVRIGSTLL